MPEPNDPLANLPDILRDSSRPIIIYQGPPPSAYVDQRTNNALGLLAWLALITICLGIAAYSAWTIWNPTFDATRFSPIYAQGSPRGLTAQLEERREINSWAEGLVDFRDQLRAATDARRVVPPTHPLITDRQGIDLDHQGIDEVRRQWDAMCANIRARIYDRRFAVIDTRIAQLNRDRNRAIDGGTEQQQLDSQLEAARAQRADLAEQRRTDSNPTLRCMPAAQADVCSDNDQDPWCNPQLRREEEFADQE